MYNIIHVCFVDLACVNSVSIVQVLDMLDALRLSQYRAKFEEESIGGSILIDCDENTLEKELGMAMKIHRLKLLQIIRGDTSAQRILESKQPLK